VTPRWLAERLWPYRQEFKTRFNSHRRELPQHQMVSRRAPGWRLRRVVIDRDAQDRVTRSTFHMLRIRTAADAPSRQYRDRGGSCANPNMSTTAGVVRLALDIDEKSRAIGTKAISVCRGCRNAGRPIWQSRVLTFDEFGGADMEFEDERASRLNLRSGDVRQGGRTGARAGLRPMILILRYTGRYPLWGIWPPGSVRRGVWSRNCRAARQRFGYIAGRARRAGCRERTCGASMNTSLNQVSIWFLPLRPYSRVRVGRQSKRDGIELRLVVMKAACHIFSAVDRPPSNSSPCRCCARVISFVRGARRQEFGQASKKSSGSILKSLSASGARPASMRGGSRRHAGFASSAPEPENCSDFVSQARRTATTKAWSIRHGSRESQRLAGSLTIAIRSAEAPNKAAESATQVATARELLDVLYKRAVPRT